MAVTAHTANWLVRTAGGDAGCRPKPVNWKKGETGRMCSCDGQLD